MCAANWWPLVQGMMLLHRANLREATLATWARTQSARAKPRDSLWRAWVCRSLKIAGPHNSLSCGMNGEEQLCPIRGKLLSRRDLWVLKRASALAGRIPQLTNRSDPDPDFDRQARRHVLDWLHVLRARARLGCLLGNSLLPPAVRRHTDPNEFDIVGDSDDSDNYD